MQPNEQDPRFQNTQSNQNGYISPTGANIPEYLHMEPQNEEKPRSRRILFTVMVSILLILAIIFVGIALHLWIKDSEKRNFYIAVEGLASTKYIERDMRFITGETEQSLHVTAKTNLSDISNPQSSITYRFVTPKNLIGVDNVSDGAVLDVEQIYLSRNEFYQRFKTIESIQRANNIKINQWYSVPENSDRFHSDSLILLNLVNTPITLPLIGNLSQEKTQEYNKTIADIYEIQSSTSEELNGIKISIYNVKINTKELNETYNNIFSNVSSEDKIGIMSSLMGYVNMKVWVKNDDKKILKTVVTQDGERNSITVNYLYPSSFDVAKPEGATVIPSSSKN